MIEYEGDPGTSTDDSQTKYQYGKTWTTMVAPIDRNLYSSSARSEPIDHQEYITLNNAVFYHEDPGYFGEYHIPQIQVNEFVEDIRAEDIPERTEEIVIWEEEMRDENEIEEEGGDFELIQTEPKYYCMKCDGEVAPNGKHTTDDCEAHFKKKFGCIYCEERFNKEINNRIHMWIDHSEKCPLNVCPLCDQSSEPKKKSLFVHLKSHLVEEIISCNVCGETFEKEHEFKRHKRWAHKPQNKDISELLYCPICYEVVSIEESPSHQSLHLAYFDLNKVKKTASTQRKNHQCAECGKGFLRPAELNRHKMIHVRKEAPETTRWHCAICGKNYSHQTGLNEHKRLAHSQTAKVHRCRVCGMEFGKKSNLDRHVKRTHPLALVPVPKKTEKVQNKLKQEAKNDQLAQLLASLECPFCPSSYKSLRTLNQHINAYHKPKQECEQGGTEKRRKTVPFRERLAEREKGLLECEQCHILFATRGMLKKHLDVHKVTREFNIDKQHVYKCDDCEKTYQLKSSLLLHRTVHKSKKEAIDQSERMTGAQWICQKCNLSYDSEKDYRSHLNQARLHGCGKSLNMAPTENQIPAICYMCQPPRRFPSSRYLIMHKQIHLPRRSHLCWTCHKSFRTSALLALHRAVHDTQGIQCDECGASFQGRGFLHQHKRTVHTRPEAGVTVVQELQENRNLGSAQSFAEYGLENEPVEPVRAQSADWMVIPANYQPVEVQQAQPMIQYAEPISNSQQVGEYEEMLLGADVEVIDSGVAPIRCVVCLHTYDSIDLLLIHWQKNADEREHSFAVVNCPICAYTARGVADAVQHVRNAHRMAQKPTMNYVQENTFLRKERKSNFAQHACNQCEKSFRKKSDLINHERIHTDERPFKCVECLAAFRTVSTLNRHKLVHSEESYLCIACDEKFHCKSSLRNHLTIHTGEKPHECHYCDDTFRTRQQLSRHERKEHSDAVPNCRCQLPSCTVCETYRQIQDRRVDEQILTSFFKDPLNLGTSKASGVKKIIKRSKRKFEMSLVPTGGSYRREAAAMNRAITVVTAPKRQKMLATSATSAFDVPGSEPVQEIDHVQPLDTTTVYFLIKKTEEDEYRIDVGFRKPLESTIRQNMDTITQMDTDYLGELAKNGQYFSVVLYEQLQLSVSATRLMNAISRSPNGQLVRKLQVSGVPPADGIFSIYREMNVDFIRRCDICEEEFATKLMSDEHFESEDHETAMHTSGRRMITNIGRTEATQQPNPEHNWGDGHFIRKNGDLTCQICGKRCMDQELLVAHIRREHDQDSRRIPPRPVARTAPIH